MEIWGETAESGAAVCPGESNCDDWKQPFEPDDSRRLAVGSEEYHVAKEEAICHGCRFFPTKTANVPDTLESLTDDETAEIVADIENLIDWEDAGFKTDWNEYSFSQKELVRTWRMAEQEIERLHTKRFQAVINGFLK